MGGSLSWSVLWHTTIRGGADMGGRKGGGFDIDVVGAINLKKRVWR